MYKELKKVYYCYFLDIFCSIHDNIIKWQNIPPNRQQTSGTVDIKRNINWRQPGSRILEGICKLKAFRNVMGVL